MSVEEKLDELLTLMKAAAPASPVDISGLATSAEVSALSAQVTALAAVIGTETPAVAPDSPPAA